MCPGAKLHVTALVIEREPGDVNLAGGLEYPGWDLADCPVTVHNDVGGESGVKVFICTVVEQQVRLPHLDRGDADVLQ